MAFIDSKATVSRPLRPEHLRLALAHRLDDLGDRHVHAQVDDVEAGDVEHRDDDVLADVVDVALHGAHHDGAELLAGGVGLEVRLQLGGDALHDLAGHDELGDERLAVGEPLADDVHRLPAGGDDLERVRPALQLPLR